MEVSKTTSSKILKKYIAIGGIGLAIFGASYYLIRKLKKRKQTKDLVIKIISKIKWELYPLLNTVSGEVIDLMGRNQLRRVPEEYKRKVIERGKFFLWDLVII